MIRPIPFLLAALALSVLVSSGAAQSVVEPDQRVRFTVQDGAYPFRAVGYVVDAQSDTLVLQVSRTQHRLAVSDIVRLEISRGKEGRVKWGVIGGMLGALAGVGVMQLDMGAHRETVLVRRVCPGLSPTCQSYYDVRPYSTGRGAVFVGGGLTVGAVMGALLRRDRWEVVRFAQPGDG